MSNAAVTAGASPLDHSWAIGSLPCTKPGMKGGARVLDLSKIIDSGGSSLTQLSVLECVELLAPLVESVGHQEVSSFKAVGDPGERSRGSHRRHGSLSGGGGTSRHGNVGPGRPPRLAALARLKVFLPALPEQSTSVQWRTGYPECCAGRVREFTSAHTCSAKFVGYPRTAGPQCRGLPRRPSSLSTASSTSASAKYE